MSLVLQQNGAYLGCVNVHPLPSWGSAGGGREGHDSGLGILREILAQADAGGAASGMGGLQRLNLREVRPSHSILQQASPEKLLARGSWMALEAVAGCCDAGLRVLAGMLHEAEAVAVCDLSELVAPRMADSYVLVVVDQSVARHALSKTGTLLPADHAFHQASLCCLALAMHR
jgi:hypothetical protein